VANLVSLFSCSAKDVDVYDEATAIFEYNFTSSANNFNVTSSLKISGKSLIYNKNNMGPRQLP